MLGNHGYCTEEDVALTEKAATFPELRKTAVSILKRMPRPVIQVCGRISSGGGTIEENSRKLNAAIAALRSQGKIVFCQVEFQAAMLRIIATPYYQGQMQLLEEFYLPLFEDNLIHVLAFLHGWETSHGAKWEYEQALRLNLSIEHLPENFGL